MVFTLLQLSLGTLWKCHFLSHRNLQLHYKHSTAFKSYWSWNDMAKDHERNYFNVYTSSTLGFSDSAFSDICSYVSQVLSYKVIFTFSQPRGVELTPTKWNAMAFFPSFSNAGGVKVQRTSHKQQNHTVGGKKWGGGSDWVNPPWLIEQDSTFGLN